MFRSFALVITAAVVVLPPSRPARADAVQTDHPLVAPKTAKQEKIKKIFDLTKAPVTFAAAMDGMTSQIVASYKQRNPEIGSEQTRELIKILRSVNETNRDNFIGLVADAWDSVYSDAEITAYYDYLASPDGASFMAKSQLVKDQVAAAAKAYAATVMLPEITKAIQSDEILKGIR